MLNFFKLPLKTYLNNLVDTNGLIKYNKHQIKKWAIKYNKHQIKKKYVCLFSEIFLIIFHNLRGKSEIILKAPHVRVAANHTSESQLIKVGVVLESFQVDLFISINFIIATTNKTKQNKAKQLLLGGSIIGKKTTTTTTPGFITI